MYPLGSCCFRTLSISSRQFFFCVWLFLNPMVSSAITVTLGVEFASRARDPRRSKWEDCLKTPLFYIKLTGVDFDVSTLQFNGLNSDSLVVASDGDHALFKGCGVVVVNVTVHCLVKTKSGVRLLIGQCRRGCGLIGKKCGDGISNESLTKTALTLNLFELFLRRVTYLNTKCTFAPPTPKALYENCSQQPIINGQVTLLLFGARITKSNQLDSNSQLKIWGNDLIDSYMTGIWPKFSLKHVQFTTIRHY